MIYLKTNTPALEFLKRCVDNVQTHGRSEAEFRDFWLRIIDEINARDYFILKGHQGWPSYELFDLALNIDNTVDIRKFINESIKNRMPTHETIEEVVRLCLEHVNFLNVYHPGEDANMPMTTSGTWVTYENLMLIWDYFTKGC